MASKKHVIASDADKNPALANELATLRGSINRGKPSKRFTWENHSKRPAVIITDTQTGRTTTVSLYAAAPTIEALRELFPEE